MKRDLLLAGAVVLVIVLCVLGWRANRAALLATYLAAWWCAIGLPLGGLVLVWMHNLTGGAWGEAIRGPLLAVARQTWFGALLFVPLLFLLPELYPWVRHAGLGPARWAGELGTPAFKSAWLQPGPFIARSVLWLVLWSVLAMLSQRPRLARSKAFASIALLLLLFSLSLAALDWIMSLTPLWYSSIFGLLVLSVQALGGMALAIVLVGGGGPAVASSLGGDLGNLLLTCVMTWAYLAFMQFLIIWAENLPHEIVWYAARRTWLAFAWLLAVLLFALPTVLLLFRAVKRTPDALRALAVLVLAMVVVHAWWLVLPSVPAGRGDWWWAAPLGWAALLVPLALKWRWRRERA